MYCTIYIPIYPILYILKLTVRRLFEEKKSGLKIAPFFADLFLDSCGNVFWGFQFSAEIQMKFSGVTKNETPPPRISVPDTKSKPGVLLWGGG